MSNRKKRPLQDVRQRCLKALQDDPRARELVQDGLSPTSTFEMIFRESQDRERAKAARWLAVLRRDYPGEYRQLTAQPLRHVNHNTAQKGNPSDEKVVR